MRRNLLTLTCAAALLLAATAVFADIGPPVKVELLGPPRAAIAGKTFAGELRITSGAAAAVRDVRLTGEGWGMATLDAPQTTELQKNAALAVKFEALCENSDRPLTVSFEWNGRTINQQLDLSEKSVRYATGPIPVASSTTGADEPARAVSPEPRPARGIAANAEPPVAGPASISIRVRGRFTYTRPDLVTLGVDGMSVDIYDEDPGVDDFIAGTVTDVNGYFDTTFEFSDSWETYPDIYIKFRTVNAEAEVEHPTWGTIYTWETTVTEDVTSYLNVGTIHSGDESMQPALHLMSSMTRNWRWFMGYVYDPRYVEVEWPDGDEGAWYTSVSEEIHISREWEWSDQVPTHEHGHHWMECYDPTPLPGYCNEICDDSIVDCGHCLWCVENGQIAWSEGLPDYLAYVIPMTYQSRYGTPPADTMWVQSLDICNATGGSGTYDPSDRTEGFVAAVLVDIHDTDLNDHHTPFHPWGDVLSIDSQEILACADSHNPIRPYEFLFAFKSDYPAVVRDFWETAANCGFDVDQEAPGTPTTIVCLSHSSGVESPDATVDMEWSLPADDASGVDEYSWQFSAVAGLPDTVVDGSNNHCTSTALAAGTYFFSVRAKDRSGRWCPSFVSWGPIVIRPAEPANLTDHLRAGWSYPLVPSSSNASSGASATVSATLPGYTSGTYWNIAGVNEGESGTSAGFSGMVYADDVYKGQTSFVSAGGGVNFYKTNGGPITVPGGRHTLHGWLDAGEDISETNETDNEWGHQFVWTPYHLVAGTIRNQPSIENAFAGWENVTDGSTLWYNQWGVRFDNSGYWNACVVWANENDNNYDIRMHLASTGATNGFTTPLVTSSLSAGKLDAVIVNQNSIATPEYDVGVYYTGVDVDLGFKAVHIENDYADFDVTTTTTLGPDAWLNLFEFNVGAAQVGPVSVFVWTDPVTPNVHIQWRPEDYVFGGLANCSAEAVTGADGRAVLQFEVASSGYNNLAVYRHPKDGATPAAVSFQIIKTPADLTPYWATGWYAPLVPRPAMDGTLTSVPMPDTLIGNASTTYYNVATRNLAAGAAESLNVRIWLDGGTHAALMYPTFIGNGSSRVNFTLSSNVRGGRHTLSQNIDPLNRVRELNEANNVYGTQYVWSPLEVALGLAVSRYAPAGMTGGWQYVTTGEARWYNCDGLRIPANNPASYWATMAVMPGDTSNVDVRLHQRLLGAKNGFAANLAYSTWGRGMSDYVLVNFNQAARGGYDVGVVNETGAQNYTAFCTQSSFLGGQPNGTYGPYLLGANGILRLHEMHFAAGIYQITLKPAGVDVNWGMSLHPNDAPYMSKSHVVENGAAWMGGPGVDETITVTLYNTDYYCLAVWKSKKADLGLSGQYTLQITPVIVGVPEEGPGPVRTAFTGISPNPFRSGTMIHFDLASPATVSVEIYDLKGSRVWSRVEEREATGRYSMSWNGCDDRGRRLASGFYIVRMTAGDVSAARKIVMLR